MKTLTQSTLLKYLLLLFFVLLSACTGTPDKPDDLSTTTTPDQAAESDINALAQENPNLYLKLASESSGELRQKYFIKAAALFYLRGDFDSAKDQLENINAGEITDAQKIQFQMLAAKLALANHNASLAIELLPRLKQMTVDQFIEIGEIRAKANAAMGYLMAAIKTRIKIDSYYKDEQSRNNNHSAIWSALNSLPSVVLEGNNSKLKSLQGWLELARIMRTAQVDGRDLQNKVLDWGTDFPEHPVTNAFIDMILNEHLAARTTTQAIAVLLPSKGPYQPVTEAIKSGFLSAYYADNHLGVKPSIRFYDSSDKTKSFMTLYQQAVKDGADIIVGPLDKSAISQLSQLPKLEVPVLTLNYAEEASSTNSDLYQFGLLPEDEARQAAEQAIRENKTRAAILVPDSPWGQRLKVAFQQRYTELGGSVLSSQSFNDQIDDYSLAIKQLLNLHQSNNRHKNLQRLLGTSLKYTPYRRQDIDMIFLAATHRSARGIMPAFKFHHAGDLPVYSTSHVYTGNRDKLADIDLNGLMFCDTPWTLTSNDKLNHTFSQHWPEKKNYTRLFALGVDSYRLLYNLNFLSKYEFARFSGQTGNIYMDENNRLHRELLWAKFRRGIANYINTTTSPEPIATVEKDQS